MKLKFQNNTLAVQDVDMNKRTVTGYFSAFGNVDSDGDMIVRGAYAKTISENKSRIAHLLQHQIDKPIGKIMELEEDDMGLRFTSVISKSTLGNDTLIQYQEGILKEHSVGFMTMKGQPKGERENSYYEIQEVKLWEGSTVTWGANPMTPVTDIKTLAEAKEQAGERITKLTNFMRHASVSDDTFRLLEFELEQLKHILTLTTEEPAPNHSKAPEPSFDFVKFQQHLKS